MTVQAAFEGMQPKAGKIHPYWAAAPVQRCQDTQEFRRVSRCHPRGASFLIQLFQAAVPKRFDHRQSVWCLSTVVNYRRNLDGLWSEKGRACLDSRFSRYRRRVEERIAEGPVDLWGDCSWDCVPWDSSGKSDI